MDAATSDPFLAHPVGRWLLDHQNRLRLLDRRRPWLFDTAAAVVILVLSVPELIPGSPSDGDNPLRPGAIPLVAAAALFAPVWWRRRRPVAAFAAVVVILLVQWSAGIWLSTGMVLLAVLYSVAAHSSMRALLWTSVTTAAVMTFNVYVLATLDEYRLATLLLILGTCTGAVATGLTVRTSRAYLTALETDRERQARLAVAAERARVAREMHDIVGHHVSVIVSLADGTATMAANRRESTTEPLRLIGETGRQALDDLRRVLGVLRDGERDAPWSPQPGLADLERLLAGVRTAGLTVTLRTSGDLRRLGQGLELAVYRIVQEALTNSLKHAGPGSAAQVEISEVGGRVRVRVADRSVRPRPARPSSGSGHGIVGIRERAGLYDGVVTAGLDGDGWVLDVVMTEPATRNP